MKVNQKVSILIISFNSGKYLKNTIDSCLNQKYDNFDILILDNNSNDGTKEYLENLNNDKIKIFFSYKNLGPYSGLNFLLDKTNSDYIAIQDHDDIYHPDKIKKSVEFLENNKGFIGCGNNTLVFFEKTNNGYIYKPQQKNHVMHTSLVFRNKGFRYRNNENYFLEDLYFQRKILLKYGEIGNIDKVLNLHLIKGGDKNLSSNWGKITFQNIRKFFNVYGFGFYGIQIFSIFIIKKIFFSKFKKYEQKLIDKKYGLLNINKINKDKNLKILLDLFKKV